MESKRIIWVDIYKAIAIILVVIGHSTNLFNLYIYQFHMAAFFLISGYTFNYKNKSLMKIIWDKTYTLLLPLLTNFIILNILLIVLTKVNLYSLFLEDTYIGIKQSVSLFLKYGNNYVFWMGATWFIIELFVIIILHKLMLIISKNNYLLYLLLSLVLYIFGIYLVRSEIKLHVSLFYFDIAFIGQIYFAIGVFAREISSHCNGNLHLKGTKLLFAFLTSVALLFCGRKFGISVDYPSRTFNHPVWEIIFGLNGCFFVFLLSLLLSNIKYINNWLVYIGKRTMGVIFYHFMFFNISYVFLYSLKIVPLEYIKRFTPTDDIGRRYWILITLTSIFFSILLWNILNKIKPVSFFWGKNVARSEQIYQSIKLGFSKILRKFIKLFSN